MIHSWHSVFVNLSCRKSMAGFQLDVKVDNPPKPSHRESSPKGTQRSKKSEVTAAALEFLLDDIYVTDTHSAKVC